MKNPSNLLLLLTISLTVGIAGFDRVYLSRYEERFIELEKQRIITSNKLATAKIVYENLNHVHDLISSNMDFPGQKDTLQHESVFFDFLTTCVNDLKLRLISVKPARPVTANRITTFGYDIVVEGDFFKFGELCAKFENNRRIISVENFDVNTVEDIGSSGKQVFRSGAKSSLFKGLSVSMRVNTYRLKKSVELPPIMTPQQIKTAAKLKH